MEQARNGGSSLPNLAIAACVWATMATAAAQPFPGGSGSRVIWVAPGALEAAGTARLKSANRVALQHVQCRGATCSVPVKVTVDPNGDDPTGRTCAVDVPFVVVLKNKNAKITWDLTESISSRNARFRDSPMAGDGIRIYQDPANPRFKNRNRITPKQFGWDRDHDVGQDAQVFLYDIYIEHDYGDGRCDPPDPLIVNRD